MLPARDRTDIGRNFPRYSAKACKFAGADHSQSRRVVRSEHPSLGGRRAAWVVRLLQSARPCGGQLTRGWDSAGTGTHEPCGSNPESRSAMQKALSPSQPIGVASGATAPPHAAQTDRFPQAQRARALSRDDIRLFRVAAVVIAIAVADDAFVHPEA